NDSTTQSYASGLIIQRYNGYRTVEHSGADAGYRSNIVRLPDQHFSVVVLANVGNINIISASYKVVDIFWQPESAKDLVTDVKVDNTILKGWAGTYFDINSKTTLILNYINRKLVRTIDTLKAI